MKSLTLRRIAASALAAATLSAVLAAPAEAGRGWGHRGGWHHGYRHSHYHGGTDWWAVGALALVGTGLYLAATSRPDYPEIPYTPAPPPDYSASYDAPPPAMPDESAQYYNQYEPSNGAVAIDTPAAYPVAPSYNAPAGAAAARTAGTDCHRHAINQSGYDPATHSQWTTQVQVDSYQRALRACQAG